MFKSKKELKEESFYKENFYKQISEIIKKPENFNKCSSKRKFIISEKLKTLTILNDFTQVFQDEQLKLKNLNNQFEVFENILRNSFNKKIKRKDSAEIANRLRQCTSIIMDDLISKGYIDSYEFEKFFDKVDYYRIFHSCVSVMFSCIEHVKDSRKSLHIKDNEIVYIKFLHRLQTALYLYITSVIVEGNPQMSEILKETYDNHNKNILGTHYFYELSNQIGEVFLNSLNIQNNKRIISFADSNKSFKSLVILRIPEEISDQFISGSHLPEIYEPQTNYDKVGDFLLYTKKIKNGLSSINLSKKAVLALKISQRKKFSINEDAIKLFDYIDNCEYKYIKDLKCLPFVPLPVFTELENRINKLNESIDNDKKRIYIEELYKLKKKKEEFKEDFATYLQSSFGITPDESQKFKDVYELEKEYESKAKLRRMHNTILKFAKIFKGFPIYFINSLDYRGRMYPWSYMFNRTSGIYKYLLNEFGKERIDLNTLNLMKDIYCQSLNITNFYLDKKEIILKHKKKFFYYILMGLEIERLIKSRESNKPMSTNFMIEVDQKSSSSVLLSIVLGDLELANDCNIFGKSEIDPPTKLMRGSNKYFSNLLRQDTLEKLSCTRDIHKYLMMCKTFNQTIYGRKKTISDYIDDYEDIESIAINYDDYVNSIYNNLSNKINLFNTIIKFYLNNVGDTLKPIVIDTVCNSRAEWTIFPNKSIKNVNNKRKYKSVLKEGYKSYTFIQKDVNKMLKEKIVRGTLASFIHSIDSSIMRLIIIEVYEKCDHIINHLHDSIQMNPKYYKQVMEAISNVYVNNELHECLDKNLLENLRARILPDKREEFNLLVGKLKDKNFNKIIIKSDKFDPEPMFPSE